MAKIDRLEKKKLLQALPKYLDRPEENEDSTLYKRPFSDAEYDMAMQIKKPQEDNDYRKGNSLGWSNYKNKKKTTNLQLDEQMSPDEVSDLDTYLKIKNSAGESIKDRASKEKDKKKKFEMLKQLSTMRLA
jgi:hypothetical protein